MKKIVRVINSFFVTTLCLSNFASAALHQNIEVNQAGSPLLMTLKDASFHCLIQGLRLPTAREIADDATAMGLTVEDTKFPDLTFSNLNLVKESSDRGYVMKNIGDDHGVLFYYINKNYKYQESRPTLAIWSSSIIYSGSPKFGVYDFIRGYKFVVNFGYFSQNDGTAESAFACVK